MKPKSRATGVATIILFVLLIAAAYTFAYFSLPLRLTEQLREPVTVLLFDHQWQVILFRPAAAVEQALTGHSVTINKLRYEPAL